MLKKEGDKIRKALQNELENLGGSSILKVYEGDGQLSFTIRREYVGERIPSFTTGWRGFVNFVIECEKLMPRSLIFDTIIFNGVRLNDFQVGEFWKTYDRRFNQTL